MFRLQRNWKFIYARAHKRTRARAHTHTHTRTHTHVKNDLNILKLLINNTRLRASFYVQVNIIKATDLQKKLA
jgi:hypothetical protein